MSSKLLPLILLAAIPTASENLAAGYHIGQQWMNTTTGAMYKCVGDGSWQQSYGYGDSPTFADLTATGAITAAATVAGISYFGEYGVANPKQIFLGYGVGSATTFGIQAYQAGVGYEPLTLQPYGASVVVAGSAPVTVNAGEVRIGGGQIKAVGSGGFGKAVNVGTHDDNASYLGVSRLSASNKYAFISAGFDSSGATQNDTGMSLNVLDAGGVQIQAIKLASNGAATFVGSVTAAGAVTSTSTLVSASNISPGAGVATSALTIGRETSGGGWIQSYGSSGVEDMRIQPLGGAATFGGRVTANGGAALGVVGTGGLPLDIALGDGGTGSYATRWINASSGAVIASIRGDGLMSLNSTAASTSTTTGALVVGGGIGVGGTINCASGGAAYGGLTITGLYAGIHLNSSSSGSDVSIKYTKSGQEWAVGVGVGETSNNFVWYDITGGAKRLVLTPAGDLFSAGILNTNEQFRVTLFKTPSSASAAGVVGSMCYDTNYIYVCVAANTWKRVAIATW